MSQTYHDDLDYLADEYRWLRVRCLRIQEERSEQDAKGGSVHVGRKTYQTCGCHIDELREKEAALRSAIDSRLEAHSRAADVPDLGLFRLCQEHGLSPEEKLVLLIAGAPGIGQTFSEDVLAGLGTYHGAVSVEDATVVLGADTLRDCLNHRAMLRPDSKLVSTGLIELRSPSYPVGPETLMATDVRLTLATLATLTGDKGFLDEAALEAAMEDDSDPWGPD